MRKLDILTFNALDADQHLLKVTNEAFKDLVQRELKPNLTEKQVQLYEKLLQSDRSRYIAAEAINQSLGEDYQARYARYRRNNRSLVLACVDAVLNKSNVDAKSIRAVVSNSTVGGMVPNLTSIICNHLGLGPSTKVMDLGYMGCAAALLALEIVEDQLAPGEVGLIVSPELTSVMINLLADSDASLVANTVFGDGVGAFLVAKRPHRQRAFLKILGHAGSILTDDKALDAITYETNAVYHEIRLNDTIPEVASKGVRYVLEPLVRRHLMNSIDKLKYVVNKKVPKWQHNVDFAVLHTAGNKVLEGLTQALALDRGKVQHNFEAFKRYGNTSSASIYYALSELVRRQELKRGHTLLFLGYGSGFFTRGMVVEVLNDAVH